jgi:hypothetical protein
LAFLNQYQRQIQRRLQGKFWKVYLKILVIVTVMMWKVAGKTLKIDPGSQAMQFLENQPLLFCQYEGEIFSGYVYCEG